MATTPLWPLRGVTKETTEPTYSDRGQTMRTNADRMTQQNKHNHNNTPLTYKVNTNHKTTTTKRQALHHRRTTNHWQLSHRHNHHYHLLNLIRTTSENHPIAIFWTDLPAEFAFAYMGSKANQNSMVWRAPLRAHLLSGIFAIRAQQEQIRIAGRFNYTPVFLRFGL